MHIFIDGSFSKYATLDYYFAHSSLYLSRLASNIHKSTPADVTMIEECTRIKSMDFVGEIDWLETYLGVSSNG